MFSNADNIKIVAKFGKDLSLPFEVMQVCAKCAGFYMMLIVEKIIVN